MKKCSLILLMILFSALCSPLTIIASPSDSGSFLITLDVCLIALDVCHSSGSFMSVNADSPLIQECCLNIGSLVFSGYIEEVNSAFNSFVIISKQERPPEV